MSKLPFYLLLLPAVCAVLGVRTGKYAWNLAVTGGCLLLLLFSDQRLVCAPLLAALALSLVGDYFMAHKTAANGFYLYGIAGFFAAHLAYLVYILTRFRGGLPAWIVGALLLIGYGLYVFRTILPNVADLPMRVAVTLYAAISCASLALSLGLDAQPLPKLLFILGILALVFSDTVIAETDFAAHKRLSFLIMPTYFACHILVTAGALFPY